jgi:hypothetical protein
MHNRFQTRDVSMSAGTEITLTLRPLPGVDPDGALRVVLKVLETHGLLCHATPLAAAC